MMRERFVQVRPGTLTYHNNNQEIRLGFASLASPVLYPLLLVVRVQQRNVFSFNISNLSIL